MELRFDNAKVLFRNFSGREVQKNGRTINSAGSRNFCVVIEDPNVAQAMINDGWNVKVNASEDYELPLYYLPVAVRFDKIPPTVFRVTEHNKLQLTDETIGNLDYETIKNADMLVSGSTWDDNGTARIKAYLKLAYFVVEENPWEQKYGVQQ